MLAITRQERLSLHTLPYDLLLNIAQHLGWSDIHAVQVTCRSLHDFATTRPVYRNLAVSLLRRCRALPLEGFQRLSDLSTEQLVSAVAKAIRLESAFLTRTPRPSYALRNGVSGKSWYKVISAPPNEEVDWLSPITSSYSLCATKSGKVVCWDVHRDVCLAEWDPRERWELWKCRVDFDNQTVFFTMAKVLHRSSTNYDDRLMEFVLMKLQFPEPGGEVTGSTSAGAILPTFSSLATFRTIGIVMNVFLLDPPSRLLSAFVWVAASNTIGLFALLDWDKEEYVFIDTGLECTMSSNWSCILHQEQIVIHSEESSYAHQYFYPISVLQQYVRRAHKFPSFAPSMSARVGPSLTMTAPFIFPSFAAEHPSDDSSLSEILETEALIAPPPPPQEGEQTGPSVRTPEVDRNPFPYPPWYPESAHFVRQWWPSLPSVPRLSCTVVLLADHDMVTHRTRYVLAQHYFRVPLFDMDDPRAREGSPLEGGSTSGSSQDCSGSESTVTLSSSTGENADSMMKVWYVRQPFEVVCVLDELDEGSDDGTGPQERPRPLMAVDFGHAVWIEFVEPAEGEGGDGEQKRVRFVSFPPVVDELDELGDVGVRWKEAPASDAEGAVRTLEIPDEVDLDEVETINIDQSQGAVIMSVRQGKIYILYYE